MFHLKTRTDQQLISQFLSNRRDTYQIKYRMLKHDYIYIRSKFTFLLPIRFPFRL